jgi:hypothetical protein
MGLTFNEVYNMPVFLRRYYYLKLADYLKKQREAEEQAYKQSSSTSNGVASPPKVR